MHRFSRMHLSAADALRKLDAIDLEEKSRIAEGIALIAVIDHRKDYLAAGYASMFSYCAGRLHMSEDRALKRIQVARVALRFPEVFECLADGRLSVSTAAILAPKFEPETTADLLAAAAFRTRHEILQLLNERSRAAARSSVAPGDEPTVQATSGLHAPGHVTSLADLCEATARQPVTDAQASASAGSARRGRVVTSATGGHEVRLSLTDEEHADLRQAQALLGHAIPSGDPALIYGRAMKLLVEHLEKRRFGAKRSARQAAPTAPKAEHVEASSSPLAPGRVNEPRGRSIPKSLARFVWEREGGRCAFVSADGHRCESKHRLEIDHVRPVALGGETKPENLRLLCRPHNQYQAERVLGKAHVQTRRELAIQARARAKAAAAAAEHRSKARARVATERANAPAQATQTAKHADYDDVLAALLGLGFTKAEALRGGELANATPEASLETCVRQALTELTRPVAARGERRARCTA